MPSKLCPHVLNPIPEARQFVEAGCPLVKLVNDFGAAEEYRRINPNIVVIGRVHEGPEHDPVTNFNAGMTFQAAAQAFVDRQREKYRLNPAIKIWEGPNEPAFGSGKEQANLDKIHWYGNYEAHRLKLLAEMGLRGVVGNFATGNPDLPEGDRMAMWRAFLPAVQAAKQHNGILGVHEYSSPWMWYHTGKYQKANCPDFRGPADEGDTGWLTLRYRKVYRGLFISQGLGDVPLAITEFGLDRAGEGCPELNMPAGAWKDLTAWWRGQWDGRSDPIDYWRGPERDAERYYAEQLIWIDGELRKDPYLLGACIFTFGHAGDPTWDHFEVGGTRIPTFLLQHLKAVRDQADPVLPAGCVNNARYVADVTIPDGSSVAPGATFLKTWRVKNTGTCAWSASYRLGFDSGERMGAPDATPLPAKVAANGEAEVSVSLTAPAAPGNYTGRFRMRDDRGQPFGGPLTAVIRVQPLPETKPEDAAASHDALPQQPERQQYANNLFANPGFEGGFYFVDDTRELAAPSAWLLQFAGPHTPRLEGQTQDFQRPTTAVISPNNVPREERAMLFRGREACFKLSGSRSPIWVTLLQSLAGLRPGQMYRFTAHVLPEMVMTVTGGGGGAPGSKTYAASPLAGEVRLVIESAGQTFDTGWKDGAHTPYGRYDAVNLRFVAPDSRAVFRVEVRSRWRVPGGGWYIDEMGLEAV